MEHKQSRAVFFAILAAALYALNAPISKLLLEAVPAKVMAALLYLGAAKTSTYYAVAPFIGAGLSLLIFRQLPGMTFLIALAIMAAGTWLASTDN